MRISLNTSSRWYDRLWASLIFFTRLPWWRIYQPPRDSYRTVMEHWPLTGWITGGVMAAVLYFGSMIFPYIVTVVLAIVVRLFLTGAFHEDGLTDFFDGFGGGGTCRERILAIMKDSRIGTYGVIAIMMYMLLLILSLYSMGPFYAAVAVLAADPFSKMVTAQLPLILPYARAEEESKSGVTYRQYDIKAGISLALQGILPLALFFYLVDVPVRWELIIFVPCLVMYFLYMFIRKRIGGYTGDCCGAICLLVELTFYLNFITML